MVINKEKFDANLATILQLLPYVHSWCRHIQDGTGGVTEKEKFLGLYEIVHMITQHVESLKEEFSVSFEELERIDNIRLNWVEGADTQ